MSLLPGTPPLLLLLLLLTLAGPGRAAAPPRPSKPLLPLQPESDPLPSKGVAGCSFGGRFYALEDTWHPDLGEPFGVMHCVVCYCEPQRNRRGKPTGKVSCKNIKHDCPTPPCVDTILLPGHCCRTCPKAALGIPEKRPAEPLFDNFEYFQDKEDDLHRNYNDRAYLSSEDLARDDSRTDFVALLTSGSEPWVPASSAVAKARFSLVRSSLLFSINYESKTRNGTVTRCLSLAVFKQQVHIPNRCEAGGLRLAPEDAQEERPSEPVTKSPEELKKDPNACFFEGQYRAHGSRWAPDYDRKCSVCSCQKRTVICDPVLCQPLNCSQPVHLEDQCCPVCEEKKEILEGQRAEKARDSSEGCYFDGDKTWRGAGTRWHPVVPPFGLIKCAVCTCKGATGEVHCEKVQCPRLTCSNPIRASPSDCCKQCPASEQSSVALSDMMQADGPRACRFGRQWYMHNESWHPTVPPFGEMKCITCWCVSGETHCQRQECSPASCSREGRTEDACCSKCQVPEDLPKEAPEILQEEAENSWRR
ncbi:chordin [Sphaerodactylus townsendi]|nr:chordin [Sphaerodactylus townsendi]